MNHERIWDRLYRALVPRGQSAGMHAIAGIDVAIWDIRGKALGQPIWEALGGARDACPVYVTFDSASMAMMNLVQPQKPGDNADFHA